MTTILIVDDHQEFLKSFAARLSCKGYQVCTALSLEDAVDWVHRRHIDVALVGLMAKGSAIGLDILVELKKRNHDIVVIMMTGYGTIPTAVAAMRHGAYTYLEKDLRELAPVLGAIENGLLWRQACANRMSLELSDFAAEQKLRVMSPTKKELLLENVRRLSEGIPYTQDSKSSRFRLLGDLVDLMIQEISGLRIVSRHATSFKVAGDQNRWPFSTKYSMAGVRALVKDAFTSRELRRFCHDQPTFQLVVDSFGENPSLDEMADRLLEFCTKRVVLDDLLHAIRKHNPRQYERHCSFLYEDDTAERIPEDAYSANYGLEGESLDSGEVAHVLIENENPGVFWRENIGNPFIIRYQSLHTLSDEHQLTSFHSVLHKWAVRAGFLLSLGGISDDAYRQVTSRVRSYVQEGQNTVILISMKHLSLLLRDHHPAEVFRKAFYDLYFGSDHPDFA